MTVVAEGIEKDAQVELLQPPSTQYARNYRNRVLGSSPWGRMGRLGAWADQ
jgi:hypothetical protein